MIVEKAYLELYPDAKLGEYDFSLNYSRKFNDYNANVKRKGNKIEFNLSRKWEKINDDVRIGLIQILLNKIFKTIVSTPNIELYEIFLKKVHIAIPKVKNDPILESSFDRVNEKYFCGLIEKTNLMWGMDSIRKLGSYEYGSDTITVSKIFLNSRRELLDYIMYHEMLHKKHKFYTKNGRSYHHTGEFNRQEKLFENQKQIERDISVLVRQNRRKRGFLKFFSL
ncbi:MAG: hypothetical protein KAK00_01390 [Nanoarchaeota archaeon]|nr:hypothetical protein [Nanoarchaeota archaeon]